MALAAGTKLGPYEIIAPIGAGGMGEVYRAEDRRLDRTVAIKVLPAHLAGNSGLRQRLEHEARAISSLNHPHICALYDVGHQEGTDFLVMEYLEGETLAARLARGPLSRNEILRYGSEIAEALAHAHALGVSHRDLKPGNIMLTKSGAKLLDFGLAKLHPSAPVSNALGVPTMTDLTEEGAIVGTLHYMAPEQLEGKPASAASDIFSYGAVLYEMATGRKAFAGESRAGIMTAVLGSDPPPILALGPAGGGLDRLVRACLAKRPDERWHSAHDLKSAVQWAFEDQPAPQTPGVTRRERVGWIAAVLLSAVVSGLLLWRSARGPLSAPPVVRLSIAVPEPESGIMARDFALSPDGKRLVYGSGRGYSRQLYLRPVDRLQAVPLSGTQGGGQPFFSPDGEWVGFVAGGILKRVSASGAAETICHVGQILGADWAPDGTIFLGGSSGLRRVSATGGTPQAVIAPDATKGEKSQFFPKVLPGGKAVLFNVADSEFESHIEAVWLLTRERRRLTDRGFGAQYAPSGHLVYALDGSLYASPFDAARLQVTGPPTPVLDNLQTRQNRLALFHISDSGSLAYLPEDTPLQSLVWVDRKGDAAPLNAPARYYEFPRLSPDGKRVAVDIVDKAQRDIWTYDLARDVLSQITYDGHSTASWWAPDSKRLSFGSTAGGQLNLYIQPADGVGTAERLLTSQNSQYTGSWAPDSSVLTFIELHPETLWDIWVLPLGGERKPRPLLVGAQTQFGPTVSPDGRWLAYLSGEHHNLEVYVTSFPSGTGKWRVSTKGGGEVMWARNSRELFYREDDNIMAVAIEAQSSFAAGPPRRLFSRRKPGREFPGVPGYDVSGDGKKFLMTAESAEAQLSRELHIVVNWVEELKTRSVGVR